MGFSFAIMFLTYAVLSASGNGYARSTLTYLFVNNLKTLVLLNLLIFGNVRVGSTLVEKDELDVELFFCFLFFLDFLF